MNHVWSYYTCLDDWPAERRENINDLFDVLKNQPAAVCSCGTVIPGYNLTHKQVLCSGGVFYYPADDNWGGKDCPYHVQTTKYNLDDVHAGFIHQLFRKMVIDE